jgi:hypothetical protein
MMFVTTRCYHSLSRDFDSYNVCVMPSGALDLAAQRPSAWLQGTRSSGRNRQSVPRS